MRVFARGGVGLGTATARSTHGTRFRLPADRFRRPSQRELDQEPVVSCNVKASDPDSTVAPDFLVKGTGHLLNLEPDASVRLSDLLGDRDPAIRSRSRRRDSGI